MFFIILITKKIPSHNFVFVLVGYACILLSSSRVISWIGIMFSSFIDNNFWYYFFFFLYVIFAILLYFYQDPTLFIYEKKNIQMMIRIMVTKAKASQYKLICEAQLFHFNVSGDALGLIVDRIDFLTLLFCLFSYDIHVCI